MERSATPTEDDAVTEIRRMRVAEGRSSFCGFPPPALAAVRSRAVVIADIILRDASTRKERGADVRVRCGLTERYQASGITRR
jgi:hypothetical protein